MLNSLVEILKFNKMASTIDFSSLTLNSEEARSTSELVFESAWKSPDLNECHDVQTGIQMDKYIPIMGKVGLVGQVDPGDCSTNSAPQIPTSQKQWTPKLISYRIEHCQDQIPDLLKFWKKSMIALKIWEDVDDEMIAFVTARASEATYESILRITSFGDVDASPVGDATGNELLTAGTDKTYFNMLDGLWKQIFDDQAGAAESYRHTISENAGVDKATQLNLSSTAAYDAFRDMYENISPEAMTKELQFQCTRTLFNNYLTYLETEQKTHSLEKLESGQRVLRFRGYKVIERTDWDRNIQTYQDLGTTYYLPHRAILTYKENIPVGTSDTESMESFESHYDRTDKKHYIDSAYRVDIKILLNEELACAY